MNSGQSSTKLNDMLVEFTNYVNDFYGDVDDVLYPMNHMKTGKRVSKVDILGAIYDTYMRSLLVMMSISLGATATLSIERE